MDTLSIIFLMLAFILLYQIFSELSKIRILLERPKKYKEKLDKFIEEVDESIDEVANKFTAKVRSGMGSKKSKEEVKNTRTSIEGLRQLKQKAYKNFYSDSFDHSDLS